MNFPEDYEPSWSLFLDTFAEVDPRIIGEVGSKVPSGKRAALIIEPRNHAYLTRVFNNFYTKLAPKDFIFVLAHGKENRELAEHTIKDLPHCSLWDLQVSNLTLAEYNAFCTSPFLWDTLFDKGIEKVLMFQTDTLLFKDNIDDFMEYDYVGAPWEMRNEYNSVWVPLGNGGLSLRSVPCHREIVHTHPYEGGQEDVYFSFHCQSNRKYKMPSFRKAMEFSTETLVSKDPMGTHKPFPTVFKYLKTHILK